jgi:hypothetical protein
MVAVDGPKSDRLLGETIKSFAITVEPFLKDAVLRACRALDRGLHRKQRNMMEHGTAAIAPSGCSGMRHQHDVVTAGRAQ